MTVNIRFLPDNVTVQAKAGEPLLEVAARAGVHISTGCLMGSCHACEVDMTTQKTVQETAEKTDEPVDEPVLACLTAVPEGVEHIDVNMMVDPTW